MKDEGNSLKIAEVKVSDIRVPTSDTLLGSDPFHKKPNYSCVYTQILLNNGTEGISVCFTSGAGNDWIAYGVKDLSQLLVDYDFEDFMCDPGAIYKLINDHHQLRWLADGVNRMALGCIINALWDAWAKIEKKPLWNLLIDLSPQQVINAIDWRYLDDALSKQDAYEILTSGAEQYETLEASLLEVGPKAYSTAGWLGLTDEEIATTIRDLKSKGFDCFKLKVGQNLNDDKRRLDYLREIMGPESKLMLDANQIWGTDEAIQYMEDLAKYNPVWIEEPTARDDVQGHLKISQALSKYNIKVASGEQVPSVVVFKQLIQSKAIGVCQIDASRLGGVNDVMAVILLAKKYDIPVCPHGGGIGLCNMIVHYAIWDQIKVASHSETQLVEYLEFLQEDVFINPVAVENGHYVTPLQHGWGLEMDQRFLDAHAYPDGEIWKDRKQSGSITFLP